MHKYGRKKTMFLYFTFIQTGNLSQHNFPDVSHVGLQE